MSSPRSTAAVVMELSTERKYRFVDSNDIRVLPSVSSISELTSHCFRAKLEFAIFVFSVRPSKLSLFPPSHPVYPNPSTPKPPFQPLNLVCCSFHPHQPSTPQSPPQPFNVLYLLVLSPNFEPKIARVVDVVV